MTQESLPSVDTTEIVTLPVNETPTPRRIDDGRVMPAGRRWVKGQSGNPLGRPKVEPRVRRKARKYDTRMCRVLASIAEDVKAPWSERRRAAMDLIAIGSGRPATTQELVGRPETPAGPLVAFNFGGNQPGPLSPADAYRMMLDGKVEPSADHEAFVSSEKEPK